MTTLPLKRNRYADPSDDTFECSFASRNLNEDFQTFHLRAARTQRQSFYNPGIAAGLEVSGSPGSGQITVDPGVAIDGQGRLVVLAAEGQADLGLNPPAGEHQEVEVPVILDTTAAAQGADATFYLTIEFSEINRFGEGTDCGRLEQVPWIRLQPTTGDGAFADDGSAVVLAVVSLNATGQLTSLAPQQSILPFRRQPVGQAVGQLSILQAEALGDRIQATSAGAIAPNASGGLQVTPVGGPLTVSGALGLETGAAVSSFSTDPALGGGDLAVPTSGAVRGYVDGLIAGINAELTTKASLSQVEAQLGSLQAELDTKANVGGSATQDFQAEDLRVRGLLTTDSAVEFGGDIRLRGSNIRDAGNTARITITDNGDLQLREDNGGVALTVDTAGAVRIGRSSTSRTFVTGTLEITRDLQLNGADIRDSGGTARITITDNGRLDLKRSSGSTTLSITTNGRVGVGTTAPEALLHVRGSSDASPSRGGTLVIGHTTGANIAIDPNEIMARQAGSTATLHLQADGGNLAVHSNASGRAGFGTSSPAVPLHLYSSSSPTTFRIQSSRAFGAGRLEFWSDPQGATNEWRPGLIQSTDYGGFRGGLDFYVNGAGFNQRRSSRRVLRLQSGLAHVEGVLKVNSLPFRNKRNVQWDDATKEICHDNSSRRSKENIVALRDEFSKLLEVEPKTYTRPGFPKDWEIGYIAEEMHEAGLERLVFYDQAGLPEAINYPKVCLYLTEIVKDLTQRLSQIEQQT